MSRYYDPVADFYSRPQIGYGIAVFHGSRRQVGGGIFATIQRFAVPILRRIGHKLLGMAPSVGSKAMEVVKDTLSDVRSGKRFGESLKSHVGSKIRKTLQDEGLYPSDNEQKGSGYARKRKRGSKKRKIQKGSGFKKQRRTKRSKGLGHRKTKKTGINKRKKTQYRDIFA
jgi:hypothetical protein